MQGNENHPQHTPALPPVVARRSAQVPGQSAESPLPTPPPRTQGRSRRAFRCGPRDVKRGAGEGGCLRLLGLFWVVRAPHVQYCTFEPAIPTTPTTSTTHTDVSIRTALYFYLYYPYNPCYPCYLYYPCYPYYCCYRYYTYRCKCNRHYTHSLVFLRPKTLQCFSELGGR